MARATIRSKPRTSLTEQGNPGDRLSNFVGIALSPEGDNQGTDYRAVPASDRDTGYSDRGMLGSYRAEYGEAEVRRFTGFGADEADLRRGYAEVTIRDVPAYDLANYKERLTLPRLPDEDDNPLTTSDEDLNFRRRHQRSRGFLTRPHLPTER